MSSASGMDDLSARHHPNNLLNISTSMMLIATSLAYIAAITIDWVVPFSYALPGFLEPSWKIWRKHRQM
jgi:hypothetical protein